MCWALLSCAIWELALHIFESLEAAIACKLQRRTLHLLLSQVVACQIGLDPAERLLSANCTMSQWDDGGPEFQLLGHLSCCLLSASSCR